MKVAYTASLQSKPKLDFTDAADPKLGALTWQVAGDTGTFANVRFAIASTAGPPHANSLLFDVPDNVQAGKYIVRVNVRSPSSGQTSTDTAVTIEVLPPTSGQAEVNANGVYEEDSQRNIIQPDGSQYVTDDDGRVPDFPIQTNIPGTSTIFRHPRAATKDAGFDPFAPPAPVANELAQRAKTQRYSCNGYIAETNTLGDMTSGLAPGLIQVVVYCQNASGFPIVQLVQRGQNLNRPAEYQVVNRDVNACVPIGTYYTFHVCRTLPSSVTPVLGHAEHTTYSFVMMYVSLARIALAPYTSGSFYINDKGVFYPKVPISATWAIPSVYADGHGYVKFPPGPFEYCPAGSPVDPCHNRDRKQLGLNMLKALPAPPSGFQPHHIKPISWCGDNELDNGVWLPQDIANDDEEYTAKTHSQFTTWWRPDTFNPELSRRNC